jgi:acyl-CoA thioesterase I
MHKRGKQRLTIAIIFCVLALSILLTPSAPAATRDPSPMKRIVVFGDSLSEGFLLKPSEAWPMLLADKLRAAGLNYEINNYSQSGGTTAGGLERLGPHLKGKIDIFVLELGINDVFRGTPVTEIRANLQEIIDRVKRASPSARIVICGMQSPNHPHYDYVSEFIKMYVDLAAKNDAALVPYLLEGVIADPALNLPDRFHPNAAGHKILVENVWRVLEPIIRETSNVPASRVS